MNSSTYAINSINVHCAVPWIHQSLWQKKYYLWSALYVEVVIILTITSKVNHVIHV